MKKILFALVLIMAAAAPVFAEERAPGSAKNAGQALIEVDSTVPRLNQLERRITELERTIRDEDERVRSIERDVNDLKRHNYRDSY